MIQLSDLRMVHQLIGRRLERRWLKYLTILMTQIQFSMISLIWILENNIWDIWEVWVRSNLRVCRFTNNLKEISRVETNLCSNNIHKECTVCNPRCSWLLNNNNRCSNNIQDSIMPTHPRITRTNSTTLDISNNNLSNNKIIMVTIIRAKDMDQEIIILTRINHTIIRIIISTITTTTTITTMVITTIIITMVPITLIMEEEVIKETKNKTDNEK